MSSSSQSFQPARLVAHQVHESLSFSSFVLFGISDAMIGAAWPALRQTFHVPIGDLGIVLLVGTAGAAAASLAMNRLLRRCGVAVLLVAASCLSAAGAFGVALSPGIVLVFGAVSLIGAGSGLIDGGLNTVLSIAGRQRLLNFLHGAYGVGTAIGPLLVTVALVVGNWRFAYGVLGALEALVATAWIMAAHRERTATGGVLKSEHDEGLAHRRPRRYRIIVTLGLASFFLYTGLEVAAGQWEASYGRGHLHLSPAVAGIATFTYWASLTVSRLALALPRRQVPATTVVVSGCIGAIICSGLIWLESTTAVALVGFALLAMSLGGIFPALVSLTPKRVGTLDAQHVVSWQVGAAAVGGSGISALVGLLINLHGLWILAPCLFLLALLLSVANSVLSYIGNLSLTTS